MKVIYFLFLMLWSMPLHAQAPDPERLAHRAPGVSYERYVEQMRLLSAGKNLADREPSAFESSVKFEKAVLPAAPEWSSDQELGEMFHYIRDNRFLVQSERPNFKRRSSWLFPDDGCFARAALAVRNLWIRSVPAPMKVFAFGDLSVESPNTPSGVVSWWYHVAPVVQLNGQKFVLDPAMEPRYPLPLGKWLAHMSEQPGALRVAICGSGTYMPSDACTKITDGQELTAEADQLYFLNQEWDRLLELNRDPTRELGDYPPWKSPVRLAH